MTSNFRYFLDPDVLDRVPKLFLFLGGMFLQMGILSVFMITEPTEKEDEELQELASKEHEEVSKATMLPAGPF